MNTSKIVTIDSLGGRGDGIAETGEGRVFVPYTLAGETVEIIQDGSRGRLVRVQDAAADRIDAICPHFTVCGGCAAQHMNDGAYGRWKQGIVETALAHKGLETTVDDLIDAHGTGRRRVTLHVNFHKGKIIAGFMAARSHQLLDLDSCPVLDPALQAAAAIARDLAAPFTGAAKKLDIRITLSDSGLDCDIRGCGRDIDLNARLDLSDLAEVNDLARITVHGDVVLERRQPVVKIGPAVVILPPGGFIQATSKGEATLARLVLEAVGNAKCVADLFSGIGPFALRLAPTATVHAIDGDKVAITALTNAVRHTQGLKPLTTEIRDLVRNPVHVTDLTRYDAIVFDPPRTGAEAQAREIARSDVATVIAVSCDPATFTRDAAILIEGGYRLEKVTPVDQFRYTAHVELVAVFRRA